MTTETEGTIREIARIAIAIGIADAIREGEAPDPIGSIAAIGDEIGRSGERIARHAIRIAIEETRATISADQAAQAAQAIANDDDAADQIGRAIEAIGPEERAEAEDAGGRIADREASEAAPE